MTIGGSDHHQIQQLIILFFPSCSMRYDSPCFLFVTQVNGGIKEWSYKIDERVRKSG